VLLTLDQLRAMVPGLPTGDDADDVVQMMLDATEADIVEAAGSTGSRSQVVTEDARYPALIVSHPIGAITSVTEDPYGTPLVLSSDDYRFTPGGFVLYRMTNGTNAASRWPRQVTIVYTTAEDIERRCMVQLGLCRLLVSYNPGLLSMRVGDWSETYQSTNSVSGYTVERNALLASLAPTSAMRVA
jgi:hypothetical protein